jgi:hypothetical protein
MEVLSIYLHGLRNNRHYRFGGEVEEILLSAGDEILRLKLPLNEWLQAYVKEGEAQRKYRKSALTEDIREADKKRDITFRGMASLIRAALNHYDAVKLAAAKRLQVVMDVYGNVSKRSMDEETSALGNLITELLEKHAADVKAMALKEWITELARLNGVLAELVHRRDTESADRNGPALKTVRLEADEKYRILMQCIESLYFMAESEEEKERYAALIRRLNAMIERYNNIIAQQGGRKDDDDEEENNGEN